MKKKEDDILVLAIDVGSHKTCAVLSKLSNSGFEVLNFSSCPSKGLKKGNILDKDAVFSCIKTVIDGMNLDGNTEVILSVPSVFTTSLDKRYCIATKKKKISNQQLSRLFDTAYSDISNKDVSLIHLIPHVFYVDGVSVDNPVGLEGDILEMQSMMILSRHYRAVDDMLSLFKKAGLDVTYLIMCQIASYLSTVSDEEKNCRVLLVDIGGGKTEIGIFDKGVLKHFSCLPLGGNHFTNDLSIGLALPFNECERVKKMFSEVYTMPEDTTEIEVICFDGSVKTVSTDDIFSIINPRAEEMLLLIKSELKRYGFDGQLHCAIITGGVANMKGFSLLAQDIFEIPVRIGTVSVFDYEMEVSSKKQGAFNDLKKPDFACVMGAVMYAIELFKAQKNKTRSARLQWLKRIFS
ncbi:MAG: cell division protein FtsA [Thermodesulfovibrionales bacterium]|nr:cell division protein FtsA [Thermodesulfovibrionales bacterium]